MDLQHRRLGDEVKDVGAGAADAHDRNSVELKLVVDRPDLCSAGVGVDVMEDGVFVADRVGRMGLGRDVGIERLRLALKDGHVRSHLLVVVLMPAGGLLEKL